MTTKVKVPKNEDHNGYEVLIGKGLINRVGEIIKEKLSEQADNKGFLIITGGNSARLYLEKVENSLRQAGYHNFKSVIVGEEKIKTVSNLIPIIMGGNKFHPALQTLKDYIYIPTTFLGMSNNAVMGHPIMTISDINLLNTLEYKYFMSGYSEVAKHAIMKDPEFFEWLEAHGRSIFDGDENARLYAIKKSCQIKAGFMANKDSKNLLGFGHLYGDAIQKIAKTDLLHGEMISVGMVAAFKFAHKIHLCDVEDYKRVRRHLKSMSLPVELYADYWTEENIVEAIDKTKPVILPRKIGQVEQFHDDLFHKTLARVADEIISHN
jgi:3-dehydroquinate synthase